jgi:hypothetical protein
MAQLSNPGRRLLDELFVQSGYVLDFTNGTFGEFFETEVGVDIYDPQYETKGTSKGNRFRAFLQAADASTVARALRALWEYRNTTTFRDDNEVDYEQRINKLISDLSSSDAPHNNAPLPTPVPISASDPTRSAGNAAVEQSTLGAITALASYAHGDADSNKGVLDVVQQLRSDGIDCWSDHFVPFPREGWPLWMERQLSKRRWVLVFASELYERRANGDETDGRGLGVIWEHGFIRTELYQAGKINERFLPVGFGASQRRHVPRDLRDYTYFDLESATDYHKLLSVIRDEPFITPHPLGKSERIVTLPAPPIANAPETAHVRTTRVRGEIVLFQTVTLANHPELYETTEQSTMQDSLLAAIKFGPAYDVGLHIENLGSPTRLRYWTFTIKTRGGPDVTCHLKADAWPPPVQWHKLFPTAMPLARAEALYIATEVVYVLYCQVRIKSHLDNYQQTFLQLDSFEASAKDNDGQIACFTLRQ